MTMRKFIVGNWKMNGMVDALPEIDAIAAAATAQPNVDVAICPPATLIATAAVRAPGLMIGAQDSHHAESGPHTGCISASMLKDAGAQLIILGHSERRTDQRESDADVRARAEAAQAIGLSVIICVGESEAERMAGKALKRVENQLAGSVPTTDVATLVIAYEPIWAIGTGRTPSNNEIAEMHAHIRDTLEILLGPQAAKVRILYGGSVKPVNAAELLAIENVDGALVGGASLKAKDFLPIIAAAASLRE